MAYDEALEKRLRSAFSDYSDVEVKKMFGGLCFMVSKHMCCGIVGDRLMARVGPKKYSECLSEEHVHEMDFTGKAMKGMVYVSARGTAKDADLKKWVERGAQFVLSLPPKK